MGVQNGASGNKFLYPTFPNVGYKQANISRGLLNRPILKFAVWRLVVALVNIGRPRPIMAYGTMNHDKRQY